jgi:hypothetical protein
MTVEGIAQMKSPASRERWAAAGRTELVAAVASLCAHAVELEERQAHFGRNTRLESRPSTGF